MWRTIGIFSAIALAIWLLLQLGRYGYRSSPDDGEWVLAGLALLFLLLGYILRNHIRPAKPTEGPDTLKLEQLGISQREYEVLQSLCRGNSNREIATELFITESTVKTHVSNLLVKLDVRRRTQLMDKARALNLLPQAPDSG